MHNHMLLICWFRINLSQQSYESKMVLCISSVPIVKGSMLNASRF
jgi:hypothetical protein